MASYVKSEYNQIGSESKVKGTRNRFRLGVLVPEMLETGRAEWGKNENSSW